MGSDAPEKVFDVRDDHGVMTVTPMVNLADLLLEGVRGATGELFARLENPDITSVVIDLSHTEYFGSDFIAVLLKIWKRVRGRGGKMALCNVAPPARDVLAICELDQIWPIHDSLESAVREVTG